LTPLDNENRVRPRCLQIPGYFFFGLILFRNSQTGNVINPPTAPER
jgi:hypothetical protein